MRVGVTSIEEFVENLEAESRIFQDTIRVSILRNPLDGKNREASRYEVFLQAAAVVVVSEESEFLLEMGIRCGVDYEDATNEMLGTEKAQEVRKQIVEYAKTRSWRVLPGIVGI